MPQRTPQPPQLFGSVAEAISQPFAPDRSQSEVPAGQAVQTLFEQTWVAEQAMPQPPQLLLSWVVLISQPLPVLPSQSAVPEGQVDTHVPFEQM